jgi:hypothetical protein
MLAGIMLASSRWPTGWIRGVLAMSKTQSNVLDDDTPRRT